MTASASTVICWLRQDLRITDNPALYAACQAGQVIPVFILDDASAEPWQRGAASRCWLHQALMALNNSLNGHLRVMAGRAQTCLEHLIDQHNVQAVYWNRCYEPWRIQRDRQIKHTLQARGLAVHSYNGSLLWEPWQVSKADDTPYKVFTPYYRKGCLNAAAPRPPLPAADLNALLPAEHPAAIDELGLLPTLDWHHALLAHWQIDESGAWARLDTFLQDHLHEYKEARNFPDRPGISRLSPYLQCGQISPNQIWYRSAEWAQTAQCEAGLDSFHSELGWREFSYYQLFHQPQLTWQNLQRKFDHFPWQSEEDERVRAWQQGRTGFPIVDAGMRELWQTGFMHNRVRMIVGSFLVKNLLVHWQQGQRWFWDCLVDADLASNSASWQWIAGCGADAAPYFRIFNPVTQSQKFDSNGEYIRRYVPELAGLDNQQIHTPWTLSKEALAQANIRLGETYPEPMVDLKASRQRALDAFATTKQDEQGASHERQ